MTPVVSFVIPCYKLAHLLPECVESILDQTYGDFEVLIMDDCSPDNTPEVAQSFQDPRVKHIRNEPNLGHLRNYNKGINLTRGKYVWLISADDYLRRTYILERYVSLLDRNPQVGYTFCPGVGVRNGRETEILGYSAHGNRDRIFDGRVFLKKLLKEYTRLGIVAASGMVRRECYERVSFFQLDMPYAGDWYLWCVFALYFDVGYFAEPMVCYREHDLTMTNNLMQGNAEKCATEDVTMPWVIKRKADEAGYRHLSRTCLHAAANAYALSMAPRYRTSNWSMTLEQFEESLCRNIASESERNWVRARVYAGIADGCHRRGELPLAKQFYWAGLRKKPGMPKVLAKWLLLSLGKSGDYLWSILRSFRHGKPVHSDGQSI
jgi:glycosyltransferase involved in cell wall biosynthesis